jgi:hypothetical protein
MILVRTQRGPVSLRVRFDGRRSQGVEKPGFLIKIWVAIAKLLQKPGFWVQN